MKHTFHVLGLPHTVSSKEFNACAYTQKVVKFGKMMTERGHTVIHYGHEDSDLQCSEHVTVLTNDDFKISYGSHDWRKTFFKFDTNDHAYRKFYDNAIREISKRKRKHDFILPFWGSGVRPICDAHQDLICVEPGIGYAGGHWARWKVWESYAIYHAYCGLKNVGQCNQDWYDVVIPNYFDVEDFDFNPKKEDYFLYLGRVYNGKGVDIAIQATERAGVKLVIAGQKEEGYKLPDHVEYVGYADVPTRKKLMSNAKASFLPSMYVEPFGGVQIENLLSGTPTITTDWGSFAENNLHGITGYRCRTMGDFVDAVKNIDRIKPHDCRAFGENFTLQAVAPMYEKFFSDVTDVYTGKGWYSNGNNISAMTRFYPPFERIEMTEANLTKLNILKKINTRNNISNVLKETSAKKICEIGVRGGENLFQMITDEMDEVFAVDIWKDTGVHEENDLGFSQAELDRQYELVLEKSKQHNGKVKIIREFSHIASALFNDEYFDFIYIDADHSYAGIKRDLDCWWPKLKHGGIIGMHDYENVFHSNVDFGVVKYVGEFKEKHKIHPDNFHLTDGGKMGFKSCYFIKE